MFLNERKSVLSFKKAIGIPLTLAVLCGASVCSAEIPSVPVPTEKTYSASAEIPVNDILIGDLVYVNIATKPQAQAYGFELVIEYDSERLTYSRTEINGAAADGITKITDENGRLCVAATAVGGSEFDDNGPKGENSEAPGNVRAADSGMICSVIFDARSGGSCDFKLKSLKVVYDDMTYFADDKADVSVSVTVADPKADEDNSKSDTRRGGGGGGGFSVGGKTASTTAPIPPKPEIQPETDDKSSDAESNNNGSLVRFADIDESHWAFDSVADMARSGIINGFEDGTFRPDAAVSRAEFCKMLCGIFKMDTDPGKGADFSDVSRTDWFFEPIAALAQNGIVRGSGGMFEPNADITREDTAVIIKRFADFCALPLDAQREPIDFDDKADISDYAESAVEDLYLSGILNGSDNNRFEPKQSMTRAQAAATTDRLKKIIDSGQGV